MAFSPYFSVVRFVKQNVGDLCNDRKMVNQV